ncbi:transketolase [Candidatus Daviesbacteria bacterium]|nr:transketolase [Candidatus Daviesbacteria bacterium]
MLRINSLSMIMEAGSGHPGTCLSSAEIIATLFSSELVNPNDFAKDPSDIFFSSKGHDAPLIYAALIATGRLPEDNLHKLRRLNGLPGHPDIHTPGITTNTGSLGMGLSKAAGMIEANRLQGKKGRVFVLLGDGELQEGQNYEALRYATQHKMGELIAIVDHNKIQSDTWVWQVGDLGDLVGKFKSFGWEVARCDGNNVDELLEAFDHFRDFTDKPKILIADTLKGAGVTFMESSNFGEELQFYPFHSGAPSLEHYQKAITELRERIDSKLVLLDRDPIQLVLKEIPHRASLVNPERLILSYGNHLATLANTHPDIIVLDADLLKDHNLQPFQEVAPDRFIECGISEQHMTSVAGGLARKGNLPITHTFAAFQLRALEQMYNNATEEGKIIYVGSLAGLLPGGPGHSHQAVMDIASFRAIPNLTMIEPSCEQEVRMALDWAVKENPQSSYLRLVSIPVETPYILPQEYKLTLGRGIELISGDDAVLFAYGPVMLSEATRASIFLRNLGISLSVINLPWLNRVDLRWLKNTLLPYQIVFTLDDHYISGGQGELIAVNVARMSGKKPKVISFGVEEIPVCGLNTEVLKYHGLDAESLAEKARKIL